jgi:Spy/CpxP family protein refolding chaperone
MMKIVLTIATVLLLTLAAQAKQKDDRFIVHDILPLQMPGKLVKSGALKLDANQRATMATQVRPLMHEQYNPMMQKAYLLQRKITRAIEQGQSADSIEAKVNELAQLKKEAMLVKIKAYTTFIAMLGDEQKQQLKALQRK